MRDTFLNGLLLQWLLYCLYSGAAALQLKGNPTNINTQVVSISTGNKLLMTTVDAYPKVSYQSPNDVLPIMNSPEPSHGGTQGVLVSLDDVCQGGPNINNTLRIPLIGIFKDNKNCTLEQQINNVSRANITVLATLIYPDQKEDRIPTNASVPPDAVAIPAYYVTGQVSSYLIGIMGEIGVNVKVFTGMQVQVILFPSQTVVALILELTFIGLLITLVFSFGVSFIIHMLMRRFRGSREDTNPDASFPMRNLDQRLPKAILETFPLRTYVAHLNKKVAKGSLESDKEEFPKKVKNGEIVPEMPPLKTLEDDQKTRVAADPEDDEMKTDKVEAISETLRIWSDNITISSDAGQDDNKHNGQVDQNGDVTIAIKEFDGGKPTALTDQLNAQNPNDDRPSVITIDVPLETTNEQQKLNAFPLASDSFGMAHSPIKPLNSIEAATKLADKTNLTFDEGNADFEPHNTCSICLEDYQNGDELRTLPCDHFYHSSCIDPWLINKSSKCPLCKFDCRPSEPDNDENSNVAEPPTYTQTPVTGVAQVI